MDRVENYRQILQKVVKRHAQFQPANGQIKTHAVCDVENDDYMVVDSGWNEKGRRIYDVVLHFRLQDGIVTPTRKSSARFSKQVLKRATSFLLTTLYRIKD